MKTKTVISFFLLIGLTSFGQTSAPAKPKVIIATYDSAIAYQDISYLYFTGEGNKPITFSPADAKGTGMNYAFWNYAAIKTDSVDGTEWHTNVRAVGKRWELTYTTQMMDGEGGQMEVRTIKSFVLYDSTYIAFKASYANWKAEMLKYDVGNTGANGPAAIAKRYIEYGKAGNYKGIILMCESKEDNQKRYGTDAKLAHQIKKFEDIGAANTPDGAKNIIANMFLETFSDKNGYVVQKNPVVWYTSATECFVAVAKDGKRFYYITLEKIGGVWKIVDADDNPGVKVMNASGNKFIEMRNAELNP